MKQDLKQAQERASKKKKQIEETQKNLNIGYIHVPKTGGTSVARCLRIGDNHHPIALRKELEGSGSRLRWAGTIRNPWDRTRSWFYYYEIGRHKGCSFEEWVLMGCQTDWHYPPAEVRILYQEDWIEIDGEIAIDYIMKFEDFDTEFERLCEWIGISPPNLLHYHLQKKEYQKIKARPYWEDITPRMRECLVPICEPFAEKYGYKFGE